MSLRRLPRLVRRAALPALGVSLLAGSAALHPHSEKPTDFPPGFDALQAAPQSHKLLFENALVRVLAVDLPKPGEKVPMHHHRWPSLAISWDTGGGSAHIRYLRRGEPIREIPLTDAPTHSGTWDIHWMAPEPMHSVEVVEWPKDAAAHASDPPELRIEIKVHS
jgi:hypothetical protein